jgi:hypothetical protein
VTVSVKKSYIAMGKKGIDFLGYHIARDGLSIQRQKKKAIIDAPFLLLLRFKLVLCLNYLLQPPVWFEGNLNHLGAGAFEITSRRLPFERVAAAMSKTIFDMGVSWRM